jgi:hypothetical protein
VLCENSALLCFVDVCLTCLLACSLFLLGSYNSHLYDTSPSHNEDKEDAVGRCLAIASLASLSLLSSPALKVAQNTIILPALTAAEPDAIKPSPEPLRCVGFDNIDCWFGNEDEGGGEASAQVNDSLVPPLPSPCSYYV